MKLNKLFAVLLAALLILSSVAALADITIGVPDDTTNEARALQLLVDNGIIVRNRNRVTLCGNCLRITIGTKNENTQLLSALRKM